MFWPVGDPSIHVLRWVYSAHMPRWQAQANSLRLSPTALSLTTLPMSMFHNNSSSWSGVSCHTLRILGPVSNLTPGIDLVYGHVYGHVSNFGDHFEFYTVYSCMGHTLPGVSFICCNPRSALMRNTCCFWKGVGMEKKSDVNAINKKQPCIPSGLQKWRRSHSCL